MAGLVDGPLAVIDGKGAVVHGDPDLAGEAELFGEAQAYLEHPVMVDGELVGAVRGGPAGKGVAELLTHLFAAERNKRALAGETLGRYKELSVLYEMSDALSHVLDVNEVAAMVVQQTHRALSAETSVLFLHDVATGTLDPIAQRSEVGEVANSRPLQDGIEGRVLESGRAELAEGDAGGRPAKGATLCAPLRSADRVFGVLLAMHHDPGHWDAGGLKLLSSMAAHSAAAISHARMHADQIRREALRGRIERFLSPHLASTALYGRDLEDAAALVYVDVGAVTSATEDPGVVLHLAKALALEVLLSRDATVDASSEEMLIALFPHRDGFSASAEAATHAAVAIIGVFDQRFSDSFVRTPGVGVAHAELAEGSPREALLAGVSVAATLQSLSQGRVLLDARVAAAVNDVFESVPTDAYEDRGRAAVAHEVRL